jgi:outer membrane lipoprotein-sorting protein
MSEHKKVNELLIDFALGELPPLAEDDVKKHLAECHQCNNKLKQLEALLKCTENVKQLSADAQMQESAKEKIFAAIDSKKIKEPTYRPNINLEFRRTIMKSKIMKLAAAAVIIIAVVVGINQLGGSRTSAVYAAVVEQLHNAGTMTYSIITQANIEDMPTVRVDMAFKEPGYMRITTADGYITVIDWVQGKGISIIPPRKQFIEMEIYNLEGDPARQMFEAIEKLRTLPSQADVALGEKEINGRLLQGFRVMEERVINTVWIDPKTTELARAEMEFPDAPGMSVIMTDFQFNVELDDSLFSLTPPEGFAPLLVQAEMTEVTEQDFIEYLRMWSTWTKDGTFPPTVSGWQLAKIAMEMEKQGKFVEGQTPEQQRRTEAMKMYHGMMFLVKLPAESNWRYVGENVKYGDTDTPIFWYLPNGSATYRVIYGDLSVKELTADRLPK